MKLRKSSIVAIVCAIVLFLNAACAPQASPSPTAAVPQPTATLPPVPTETTMPPTPTLPPTVTPSPTPQQPVTSYASALPLFNYDPKAPFDVKITSEKTQDRITIHDITYKAANPQFATLVGGRIAAFVVTPPGSGPFAGVLFVHGLGSGWGNRGEFLNDAIALAKKGVVSVLPAGLFPWIITHEGTAQADQLNVIHQVIELRRSLDLLLAQPGVDPQRIAYVGHDYGAMHGAVLSGVEKRIQSYVLMAGDSNYSNWALQYFVHPADPDTYMQQMAAVDSVTYLPHAAPAQLYFQFGKQDGYVSQEAADAQVAAASQPNKVDWYDADHTLNDQATADRLAWLDSQLDLK